jgi:hypothetical protein
MITKQNLIGAMGEAMATFEGFYNPKESRAKRNNNPGNIRKWGNNPIEDGYVKFPTEEAGWTAIHDQIEKNIDRGLTLTEFFAGQRNEKGEVKPGGYYGYAPEADKNKPNAYAAFVASFVKKHFGWNLPAGQALKTLVS